MFNLGEFSMKKTLVALASMAALGAFAQSSVTMYGIVEATVDLAYKNTTNVRVDNYAVAGGVLTVAPNPNGFTNAVTKAGFRVQDGNDQGSGTSRIGWRGTEDLGGGLKANFQLEMGLRVDDGCVTTDNPGISVNAFGGASGSGNPAGVAGILGSCSSGNSGGNLFGRNAWVGASGGFGEVRLGRQVLGSFSTQANGWSAGSSNGLYDAGASTAPAMGGVRFSNAIRYITPNIGGFTGSLMLAAPENTFTNNNGVAGAGNAIVSVKPKTSVDLALDYANGPLYLGFGYNTRGTSSDTATGAGATTFSDSKIKAYTLSAAYDLGVAKPYLNYTRQKTDSSSLNQPGTVAGVSQATEKAWQLGVRAPIGAATLIAAYGTSKLDATSANAAAGVTTGTTATEGKEKAFQIGMIYPLSKRTSLSANYGQYKHTQDVATAIFTPGVIRGTFTDASQKISAFNIGLKHTF
jgi:predicted porin